MTCPDDTCSHHGGIEKGMARMEGKIDAILAAQVDQGKTCATQCEKVAGIIREQDRLAQESADQWKEISGLRKWVLIGVGIAIAIEIVVVPLAFIWFSKWVSS